MTNESITESEFALDDEMQTTDSYAVNDTERLFLEGNDEHLDAEFSESLDNMEDLPSDVESQGFAYQTQPNLLEQIIGFFFQSPAKRRREQLRRLNELNESIEFSPNSPTSYVLCGEIFLERKEYHLAQADFETAIEIAESVSAEEHWGIIEQVMRDRALDGLKKIGRRYS